MVRSRVLRCALHARGTNVDAGRVARVPAILRCVTGPPAAIEDRFVLLLLFPIGERKFASDLALVLADLGLVIVDRLTIYGGDAGTDRRHGFGVLDCSLDDGPPE